MERHLDEELNQLKERLLLMGGHVEATVHKSIDALKERNNALAEEIFEDDKVIDTLELDIDDRCLKILALRQPVGTDLRFITAALKICNDLERVGDHAVNIAQSALRLNREPQLKPLVDIPRMAILATNMLREALDSFVRRDPKTARQILTADDEVDDLRNQLFRELLSYMLEDPTTITRAMDLILVSRNLERVADLATNMAEEVIFICEARVVRHHPEERSAQPSAG